MPQYTSNMGNYFGGNSPTSGNRTYNVVGIGCNQSTQRCKNIVTRTQTHCSASGIYPADNWEEYGRYCWVRLIGMWTPSGAFASRNGGWLFTTEYQNGNTCAQTCGSGATGWRISNPDMERVMHITEM